MLNNVNNIDNQSVASVLRWWVEAGVDTPVMDDAVPWIGRAIPSKTPDIAREKTELAIPGSLDAVLT